jgi:hypothetical protein
MKKNCYLATHWKLVVGGAVVFILGLLLGLLLPHRSHRDDFGRGDVRPMMRDFPRGANYGNYDTSAQAGQGMMRGKAMTGTTASQAIVK